MITGRCECGAVRYEIDGEVTDFSHCHCSICRRLHGAAFASFGGVKRDGFRYISGEDKLKGYSFSPRSTSLFCTVCGSPMLADTTSEPDMLYVSMGTVDGDVALPTGYHIFAGSKAPWVEITDGLEQHEDWPPGEG